MALNPNVLAKAISDAVSKVEDKFDTSAIWLAVATEIVSHIKNNGEVAAGITVATTGGPKFSNWIHNKRGENSMKDIALKVTSSEIDIAVNEADILVDDSLETAILLSFFSHARASDEELMGESEKGGWWGDLLGEEGSSMGSKLWLLQRAKPTAETLLLTEEYGRESLSWLLGEEGLTKVDLSASYEGCVKTLKVEYSTIYDIRRIQTYAV